MSAPGRRWAYSLGPLPVGADTPCNAIPEPLWDSISCFDDVFRTAFAKWNKGSTKIDLRAWQSVDEPLTAWCVGMADDRLHQGLFVCSAAFGEAPPEFNDSTVTIDPLLRSAHAAGSFPPAFFAHFPFHVHVPNVSFDVSWTSSSGGPAVTPSTPELSPTTTIGADANVIEDAAVPAVATGIVSSTTFCSPAPGQPKKTPSGCIASTGRHASMSPATLGLEPQTSGAIATVPAPNVFSDECGGVAPFTSACYTDISIPNAGPWVAQYATTGEFAGSVGITLESATGWQTWCFEGAVPFDCTPGKGGFFKRGQRATIEGWTSVPAAGHWSVELARPM
jgi:hypothetical protein